MPRKKSTAVVAYVDMSKLSREVGQGGEISGIDKKLLRLAARGASSEEMEDETGVPAARALVRVKEILKARSYLSQIERYELLLYSMMDLMGELRDIVDVENQNDNIVGYSRYGDHELYGRGDPRWTANLIALQKNIAGLLESGLANAGKEKDKLYAEDAKVMAKAIELAFKNFATVIHRDFPQVDEQYLRSGLETALEGAFTYLNTQAIDPDAD